LERFVFVERVYISWIKKRQEIVVFQPDLASRIAVGVRSNGPQTSTKSRELTELLFEHGMNPSRPDLLGITPLHEFARKGDIENAGIFIDHGADLHARDEDIGSTPLGWAAKFGNVPMVEFLLERGAKPNLPDEPLGHPARMGDPARA
jgi:hypothetical protein